MTGTLDITEPVAPADIRRKSKQELLDLWRVQLKTKPPEHLRKELLIPVTAYRLQEKSEGGLQPQTIRTVQRLAQTLRSNPKTSLDRTSIKPGTRLLREWNGHTHQVTVHATGFEYKGKLFKSLSLVARIITGTRWSGPLFFGLKGNYKQDPSNGKRS